MLASCVRRFLGIPRRGCGACPRGGSYVAAIIKGLEYPRITVVESPDYATHAVDDIVDTGGTSALIRERYGLPVIGLYNRPPTCLPKDLEWDGGWVVFPWEQQAGGTMSHSEQFVDAVNRMAMSVDAFHDKFYLQPYPNLTSGVMEEVKNRLVLLNEEVGELARALNRNEQDEGSP